MAPTPCKEKAFGFLAPTSLHATLFALWPHLLPSYSAPWFSSLFPAFEADLYLKECSSPRNPRRFCFFLFFTSFICFPAKKTQLLIEVFSKHSFKFQPLLPACWYLSFLFPFLALLFSSQGLSFSNTQYIFSYVLSVSSQSILSSMRMRVFSVPQHLEPFLVQNASSVNACGINAL